MSELKQFFEKKYYPVFQGTWDVNKAYVALDVIEYNNARYIAKIPVPAGTIPTNTAYWIKFIGSINDWQDLLNRVNALETTVTTQGNAISDLTTRVVQLETDITEIATDMDNVNRDMHNLIAMLIGE